MLDEGHILVNTNFRPGFFFLRFKKTPCSESNRDARSGPEREGRSGAEREGRSGPERDTRVGQPGTDNEKQVRERQLPTESKERDSQKRTDSRHSQEPTAETACVNRTAGTARNQQLD